MAESKSKANQWRVKQQQSEEDFGKLDRRYKHLAHESQQRELRLTLKLEQKVDELKTVTENVSQHQREFDTICEQLKQELCDAKTDRDRYQEERDRYKDERDALKEEYNMVVRVHEEKKQEHAYEAEVGVWKVKYSSLEDALRKEKMCELTASSNRQLNSQLQEIARQLNAEKQEKGQLSARLTALQRQYRTEAEKWLTDKSNMDRVITDMTQQVQELQRVQSQTEILRHHLQEEKQQLERELQSSQELLQKLQEEHKSNVSMHVLISMHACV